MPGKTELLLYPVVVISAVAAITDLLKGRIYNWLTLPAIGAGLMASAVWGGWAGLGNSLLGVLAGFVLYSWMFWLGHMGGGDVKLLMALGAWGGFRYALEVGVLGVLVGGVLALAILIARGRIVGFASRLYRFILALVVRELEPELPKVDRSLTMPYGLPIAIAAIWVAAADPFERWGIRLWP